MQREVDVSPTDLESTFKGLMVLKVEGMSDKGDIKNVYTESYAESDSLRAYIPKEVARKSTEIVMTLAFVGDGRRDEYDKFVEWVSGHKVRYWANDRDREVEMFQQKKIDIEEDVLKGDVHFIIVPIKFTNMRGYTIKHIDK